MCVECARCFKLLTYCVPTEVPDSNASALAQKISNLCENNFLPVCVSNMAQTMAIKIVKKLQCTISECAIIAFTIFISLKKHDIPRMSEEVERMAFDCAAGTINRVANEMQQWVSETNFFIMSEKDRLWVSDLILLATAPIEHHKITELLCGRLGIPYKHIVRIERLVQTLAYKELADVQAATSNAVVIFLYCKEMNLNIPTINITAVCGRQKSTILKNVKLVHSDRWNELCMFINKDVCI